jgi:hypothetical protein
MKDFMIFFNKIKNSNKLDLVEDFKERINYLYDEQKNNLIGFNRKDVVRKIEDLEEKRERLKKLFFCPYLPTKIIGFFINGRQVLLLCLAKSN